MPHDPARWAAAIDALAGGFFYGFYNLALLPLSGRSVSRRQWLRALLDVACAMISGAIAAFFIAPAALQLVPWPQLRDPQAVGFAIGLLAWELAGVVIAIARKRAIRQLEPLS